MQCLIDGDYIVMRAGFAAESREYRVSAEGVRDTFVASHKEAKEVADLMAEDGLEPEIELILTDEPVSHALSNARLLLGEIVNSVAATWDDTTICLSGSGNFREELATIQPYKGNRDPTRRPTHEAAIIAYLHKNYRVHVAEGEEADDWLGYTQYAVWETGDPYGSIIVSADKDLDMIPGLHYNFVRKERYFIEPETAIAFFYEQLMSGDAVDNIPGLPGIGPKKAQAAMAAAWRDDGTFDEVLAYRVALEGYREGYGLEHAEEALLENARLLWIRRHPDELWEPPKEVNDE